MKTERREGTMSEEVVQCVVCGRKESINDLIPVRLVSRKYGTVLSGVCGGCILDVDGAAKRGRKNRDAEGVAVEVAGHTYDVVRR
jgi:hypothetical protein